MTKKRHHGTTLDAFLKEEGVLDRVQVSVRRSRS